MGSDAGVGLERLRYERDKKRYLEALAPELLKALIDMTRIAKASSIGITTNKVRIESAEGLISAAKEFQ